MAKFTLSTRHATKEGSFLSIKFFTGKPDPFPAREIEARTTAEALAKFDAYKAEAAKTGEGMAATITVKKGERAPSGFRKATEAMPYYHSINMEGAAA